VTAVSNSLKGTQDSVSLTPTNSTSLAPTKAGIVRSASKLPVVLPTMDDIEVKRRTGFCDASTLMAFVVVVCNAW
jgi:serine protease inhibitor ecotin